MKRPKGKFSFAQCLLHLLDSHMLLEKMELCRRIWGSPTVPPKVKQEVHLKTSKTENVRMRAQIFLSINPEFSSKRCCTRKSSDIRDVTMD